ncbi:MAG: O-antigen ligase family protein [Rhodobacteraceae bacterium]|nr:O-antigen ligase family protein [Paracoccaceae bacterium]
MGNFFLLTRSLAAWLLFSTLVIATLALGANRPVSWTLLCLAILGLFVITQVLYITQKSPRVFLRLWFPAGLFLGALIWGALQTAPGFFPDAWAHPVWDLAAGVPSHVSADPVKGFHILMRLSCYALVFWMALISAQDGENAVRYLKAFGLFSTALAGFGLYAFLSGSNPILGELASENLSASFVNRNSYATFAGFGLIACLGLLFRSGTMHSQGGRRAIIGLLRGIVAGGWIWIVGITLCGGAVVLSESRGGAVATAIGLIALLSTQRVKGAGAGIGPVLILGSVVLLILLSGISGTMNRFLTTTDESGRFAIYPKVVEGIGDRPVLGHGIGAFHTAFRKYVPVEASSAEWNMAHNSYLENIFELGLPAALCFYLALALIGLQLLRGVQQRQRNRTVVSVALACFILAAVHSLFDFSLQMPALASFFAWLLGIGYAQSFPSGSLKDGPS